MKILNKSTKEEAKSQWTSVLQLIKVHSVHFRMQKQVTTLSHFSLQRPIPSVSALCFFHLAQEPSAQDCSAKY